MANDLSVYEEEKQVTETINAIMSKKDNFLNRIKQLYRLIAIQKKYKAVDKGGKIEA